MIVYKHYKKKEEDYVILDMCMLQDSNGEWKEAIIYKGLKSGLKFCRFESDFDLKFSAEGETDREKIQKYQHIYNYCLDKINGMLEKEMDTYSEFLYSEVISVLPDGLYRDGEKLDYGEVRRLYDKYLAEKK